MIKDVWCFQINTKDSPEYLMNIEILFLFKKKEIEGVVDYVNVGHGNYIILCQDDINIEDNYEAPFQGFWKMFFDGASSKVGYGAQIVFKNPQG